MNTNDARTGMFSWLPNAIRHAHEQRYWIYTLAAVPAITEMIEANGAWPSTLHGWTTEIVVGMLIAALAHKIRLDYRRLSRLARTDGLTGLLNRRSFDEAIESECARSRRTGSPLTILLLDLDKFKSINDRLGHHVGDQVLKCVAKSIQAVARTKIDQGFRLGGDEFAVLLPGSTAEHAQSVLARLREQVRIQGGACQADGLGMSVGLIEFAGTETVAQFMHRADAAMYLQKIPRARD